MTTAREFLRYAGIEETEENFNSLAFYVSSDIDFTQFPDADVFDEDGNPLTENYLEPSSFQEFIELFII